VLIERRTKKEGRTKKGRRKKNKEKKKEEKQRRKKEVGVQCMKMSYA
jgi:hypothetical protein